MIKFLIAMTVVAKLTYGDVGVTIDGISNIRGNVKFTDKNSRYQSSFSVVPGAQGLQPPLKSSNIQTITQSPVLIDSYMRPVLNQPQYQLHTKSESRMIHTPSKYYLAPKIDSPPVIKNSSELVVHARKKPSLRLRLRNKYQNCEYAEDVEQEDEDEVDDSVVVNDPNSFVIRRPAIQQHFYDIEHKVIVRPVGTAVIELEQSADASQGKGHPEAVPTAATVPTPDGKPVYVPTAPTPGVLYSAPDGFAHPTPSYPVDVSTYVPYPPIYNHHYPHHPAAQHPIFTNIAPQFYPQHAGNPVVLHQPEYTHPSQAVGPSDSSNNQQHVSTTPLPPPPEDSELIEPDAPAEHPESKTSTSPTTPSSSSGDASEPVTHEFEFEQSEENNNQTYHSLIPNNHSDKQSREKSSKLKIPHLSVHYTPDQAAGDQIQRETVARGDSTAAQALHVDEPDQFYHQGESVAPAKHQHSIEYVSNREGHSLNQTSGQKSAAISQQRTNEQRLLELYAVKGGVAEVEHPTASARQRQNLQLNQADIQRARVISVTPAPDHEAHYEASERSQIRRVVVSKAVETIEQIRRPNDGTYGQRLSRTQPQSHDTTKQQPRVVYVTPVPRHLVNRNAHH